MKKSILVALLLLPLAFAKGAPSQILPIPDCFPCVDTLTQSVVTSKFAPRVSLALPRKS